MVLRLRSYVGETDLAAMQDLMRATPKVFEAYPTVADLPELLDPAASDTGENTVLWEDARGQLRGFAIVSTYDNLHFHFRRGSLTAGVEREMVTWAVERVRLRAMGKSGYESLTLDASARDGDTAKVAFLLRHGFVPSGEQTLYVARSLHEPLPDLELPAGFLIRPLESMDEVPMYVAAHRAAYGTENMTVECRLTIMRVPRYHPELERRLSTSRSDTRLDRRGVHTLRN